MKMRRLFHNGRLLTLLASTALLAGPAGAQFTLLHEFAGGGSDGSDPQYTTPVVSGSTLYGMTAYGGDSDYGTVFKMNTDGTGFALLREFVGGATDGQNPHGSLTLDGTTVYGMTQGGKTGPGTIFKMNTDGTGFSLMHQFTGGVNDGNNPYGSLTLSGSALYGMTYSGGDDDAGTLFKINTDGTGFSLLHEFAGGGADGAKPYGSLTLDGSTLYGMTQWGGDLNGGTVFKVNTDGTGFALLKEFTSDVWSPYGSLALSGAALYGMAYSGGSGGLGGIFKLNTDGSGYTVLREFSGGAGDGSSPQGDLTFVGSQLYGMTRYGGLVDYGTIFKINTNGAGFSVVHEFAGGGSDGWSPTGSLALDGATLYGMTPSGGDSSIGIVFSLAIPEPSTAALLGAGLAGLLMRRRKL